MDQEEQNRTDREVSEVTASEAPPPLFAAAPEQTAVELPPSLEAAGASTAPVAEPAEIAFPAAPVDAASEPVYFSESGDAEPPSAAPEASYFPTAEVVPPIEEPAGEASPAASYASSNWTATDAAPAAAFAPPVDPYGLHSEPQAIPAEAPAPVYAPEPPPAENLTQHNYGGPNWMLAFVCGWAAFTSFMEAPVAYAAKETMLNGSSITLTAQDRLFGGLGFGLLGAGLLAFGIEALFWGQRRRGAKGLVALGLPVLLSLAGIAFLVLSHYPGSRI